MNNAGDPEPDRAPTLHWLGDGAVTVDFGDRLSEALNRRVLALDRAVTDSALPGVIETVPTYRALTVHLDPMATDPETLGETLLDLAARALPATHTGRIWQVPVHYGGSDAADLEHIAARTGLTPAACIEAHSAAEYRVAMIGFLPGFCYLTGLPPFLAAPRRKSPRAEIPASSISIGGAQTAIGSVPGPSGWHLIGRTPVRPFQPGRTPTFLFEPGDVIRFHPVSEAEAEALQRAAQAGAPVASRAPE